MPVEIKKVLRLDRLEYHETHLSIINCILPVKMTPMEIKVLASFMSLEGDIVNYRFSTAARKIVRDTHQLSFGGLSNYIGALVGKQFIQIDEHEKPIAILPLLIPEFSTQDYRIRLIKN